MEKNGKFIQCLVCGKSFYSPKGKIEKGRKYCSQKCHYKFGFSKETIKKMSETRKGRIHSEKTKRKMSKRKKGEKNPFYGKKHTEETKKKMRGANHPKWKGGERKETEGYIRTYQPNHPSCDKARYVLRSRLVMEKVIRRYLRPEEIVHHKGIKYPIGSIKNKQDDRIENLELFKSSSEHQTFHKNQLFNLK